MKPRILSVLGAVMLSIITVNAQNATPNSYQVTQQNEIGNAAFVKFNPNNGYTKENVWNNLKSALNLTSFDDMKLSRKTKTDKLGFATYRYKQFYKGTEVWGAEYILHEKNGALTTANGKVVGGLDMDVNAGITEKAALDAALKNIGEAKYRWQNESSNTLKKYNKKISPSYPKGKLVIAPIDGNYSDIKNFRLCWMFDIAGDALHKAWTVFVDANTAEVINKFSAICDLGNVQGKTKTRYHGIRDITCYEDTIPNDPQHRKQYTLIQKQRHAPVRPQNIMVYDYQHNTKPGGFGPVDTTKFKNIVSDSTFFSTDSIAGEIYWGLQLTSDFYDSLFHRNSLDDKGRAIRGLAHYSNNYANAQWSQMDTLMLYGDGDNIQLKPVVGVDVTGHELTHGVTQFSSGLQYKNESGALNESFSDIMGTGVEFYGLDTLGNWLIGEGIVIGTPSFLRSMANPKIGNPRQPDTYKANKQYWYTGTFDNGGVHTNSGVQNYWFYILAHGDTGTNDFKRHYNITGIGLEKALQISYRNLTEYITPTSQYQDSRAGSVQAAEDLFGVGSVEVETVRDAWCAVGVCDSAQIASVYTTLVNHPGISLYPNPAYGLVNIEYNSTNEKRATLLMYNMTGAIVYNNSLSANTVTSVSTSQFPAGVYLVRIISPENIYNQKLIVE